MFRYLLRAALVFLPVTLAGFLTVSCRIGVTEPGEDRGTLVLSPANGGSNVPYQNVVLIWPEYQDSNATYVVYLDVNPPTTSAGQPTNISTLAVDALLPNTTYYWRVDVFIDTSLITGPVYTFTTAAVGVNHPPVFSPINDTTISEGQTLSLPLSASDPNGDAVTFALASGPEGASVTGSTFSWTPTAQQSGSYVVRIMTTDAGSPPLSVTEQFVVTVQDEVTLADVILGRWNFDSVYSSIAIYESGALLDSSAEQVATTGENYFHFLADSLVNWNITDTALGGPLSDTFKWWVEGGRIGMTALDSVAGGPNSAYFEVQIQGNSAVFTNTDIENDGAYSSVVVLIFYTRKE